MRDLLVTLASIRRVPLWTHFYVFCFLFFVFFSLSFNFEFISFYCFNLLFLQFVLAFVWSLYVFPKWTWPVPGGQLEKRSAVVNNAIFAAELKKKEEECFVHEATRPRLLFNFRSAATIELFNADSGFEFTFFNLDQSEVTRLSQITLLICHRVPEVILLIVC